MNNESIKEILDSLKFVIDNPTLEDEVGDEQVTIINYTELNAEESKQLLDYITNLQEENERLKERENKMFGRYGINANKSKPVYQYDLDYNFIKKWNCQRDVQRELGFSEKSISNCVLGNQKTAYGFIWLDKLKELKENKHAI